MRYALCYVSTAKPDISTQQIEDILNVSEENNNRNNITGILLFSEGNFFQVLEGEKSVINELFQKIKADNRHHNLIVILQKEVGTPQFKTYISDFSSVDTRFRTEDMETYLNQVNKLDPTVQTSVGYILGKFTEGLH